MNLTDLILRSTDQFEVAGDGRTIEGIAVAWDTEALVSDDGGRTRYHESYDRRAFTHTLRARGPVRPLFVRHAHLRGSIGEVTFAEADAGLMFTARAFPGSSYADEVLAEGVGAQGKYPAVSIGHYPVKPGPRIRPAAGAHVHRTEVRLEELSLAEVGQHHTAKVLAVRSSDTPRLDAIRRRLVLLPKW